MSSITDVVCLFDLGASDIPEWFWTSAVFGGSDQECNRFQDLGAHPDDDERHHASDHWGGGKCPSDGVLAAAINYLDHREWLERIARGVWPTDERPVIMIQTEYEDGWQVYLWDGAKFARVARG